ncbi:hypothetical protein [Photobacterium damselae]|uniref:hypothetical protein n=1 Tax=Photobacterium damselae TaxID=38293 RepID=UPI00130286C7|nr:hypothetical protein [Photobacterium damselae]
MENRKTLLTASILAAGLFSSSVVFADTTNDDAPDPADVTKVVTSFKLSAGTNSNNNDFALEGELKIGGSFSPDNSFLTMISATGAEKEEDSFEDGFDLREMRARWFQVFGTGLAGLPKAGYSLDFIDRSNDDSDVIDNIIAVGGIVKVPVLSNWVMYPNIAAVQANVKDEYKIAGTDDGIGVQVNLYNAIYLSKKGTYMMVSPQYSYLDFDGYTTQDLLLEATLGTPITENRRWWFNLTYKETFSDLSSDISSMPDKSMYANDDKRQFRAGVTYYF